VRRALLLVSSLLVACASAPATSGGPASSPASAGAAEPSIVVTEAMGSPHLGDVAPDFELPDQDGKPVKLSTLRGSVVVLAFVASFCPFSKAEQPHLAKLADDYAGKGVKVVAIGVSEPDADYREYVGRMPMRFPVLHDSNASIAERFTPPGAQPELKDRKMALITSNLVIDPEGKIRFFTVLDTVHFDAKLEHVRKAVDHLLANPG
jgi:peroxiredoxin Q/BCP